TRGPRSIWPAPSATYMKNSTVSVVEVLKISALSFGLSTSSAPGSNGKATLGRLAKPERLLRDTQCRAGPPLPKDCTVLPVAAVPGRIHVNWKRPAAAPCVTLVVTYVGVGSSAVSWLVALWV